MKINREEIRKIAHLARIELTDSEENKFQREISEVIEFSASQIKKVRVSAQVIQLASESLGQEDRPRPSLTRKEALSNAPKVQDGWIVVPKVLD
jgi:aspartyl-tRNA(Asn)/glutamyl-tRNA(Gln) amidotransferase subunit C